MYKKYYKLTKNPFQLSPDPYFFCPTPLHNEALASLVHGVHGRKGFVVVTGEVGTGKTLLVRLLLEALSQGQIACAFVYNPRLSVLEFLTHVLIDLGISPTGNTKVEMLHRLNNYLVAHAHSGGTTALVVDEAQLLDWELLEEIRLLTNLETSQHKLLQIVLVGQSELDQKLDSPQLRQLKQRIGLRCRLEPLGPDELRGYVDRRLSLAGAASRSTALFPNETILILHKYSRGIPRLVNSLCEHSLVAGFSKEADQITPDIVEEVAKGFRLDIVTVPTATNVGDLAFRKSVLTTLSRMVGEIDDLSNKMGTETPLVSGGESK